MHERVKREKRNYNALLIAIGILASIVEGVFLFPFPRILRLEGAAIFVSVLSISLLLEVFSSYAFPTQISKRMRARILKGDVDGVTQLFQKSWMFMTVLGLILAIIVFLSAKGLAPRMGINLIGDAWLETVEIDESEKDIVSDLTSDAQVVIQQSDNSLALADPTKTYSANIGSATEAIKTIAPFIFVSFAFSAFKAYFMAINVNISIEIARLFTQVIKLVSGLLIAGMLSKTSLISSINGAIWGLIIGEVVGLIFLIVMYFLNVGSSELYKYRANWNGKTKNVNLDLISSLGPSFAAFVALFLFQFLMVFDAFSLVKTMIAQGYEHVIGLRTYGILFAMCWPFATFVPAFFFPNIKGMFLTINDTVAEKHYSKRAKVAESSLRVAAIVGFAATTLLFTMGGELFTTVFGGILKDYEILLALDIMKIVCFGAAFISIGITMSAHLVGMNQAPVAAIISVFCIILKIVVGIFTSKVDQVNVLGSAYSTVAALGAYAFLSTAFAQEMSGAKRSWMIGVGKPIIAMFISYLVTDLLFIRFVSSLLSNAVALIAGSVVTLLVYFAVNFLLNSVSGDDIELFPILEGNR